MSSTVRSLLVPLSFLLFISLSDCVSVGESLLGSDDDATDTEVVDEATSTPTPVPQRRHLPSPYVTPEPTPETEVDDADDDDVTGVSEDDLQALLLGANDLPPTWTDVSVTGAPTEVPGAEGVDGLLVSSFFQRSDLGPYLAHMILYTEDEDEAETAFAAIYDELDDATILDDITDEVRSWQTAEAEVDGLGDEAFAFAAIGDTGLIPVEADMVGVRIGEYVSFVIHAELMEVDSVRTMELVEVAVDRIEEAAADTSALSSRPVANRDSMSQLRWR
jgi:hypothetical protein